MSKIERLAEWLYNQMAEELAAFIDEYKVPVRKPRPWGEGKPNKEYWYSKVRELLEAIEGEIVNEITK